MGSFELTGMAFKNLLRKPETKLYPTEPQVYTERTKGHIKNDIERCILCGLCMRRCPATALTVDKPARTWTIDPFSCVQCGACVRGCPPKSLTMKPDYTPVSTSMHLFTLTKPEEEPAEEPKKQ